MAFSGAIHFFNSSDRRPPADQSEQLLRLVLQPRRRFFALQSRAKKWWFSFYSLCFFALLCQSISLSLSIGYTAVTARIHPACAASEPIMARDDRDPCTARQDPAPATGSAGLAVRAFY